MARQSRNQRRIERQREMERRRKADARKRTIRNTSIGGGIALGMIALLVVLWPTAAVGDTSAEGWDLPELGGDGRVTLADFRGKPTVAIFFASWCTECEREIPEMLTLSQQIGDQVNFVGINSQDNGRGMGDAEKWGIAGTWPLALDVGNGNGSALSMQTFGARGSPTNVIYNADGQVVHTELGGLGASQLLSLLGTLGLIEA